MIEKEIIVNLEFGFHARPSGHIINSLKFLQIDEATVSYQGQIANLRSILSVLMLGVARANGEN